MDGGRLLNKGRELQSSELYRRCDLDELGFETTPEGSVNRRVADRLAELAAAVHAQLEALFVEDVDLLRLARLPLAWQIPWSSRTLRRLERGEIERQLRAQAASAREILQRAGRDSRIACGGGSGERALAAAADVARATGSALQILLTTAADAAEGGLERRARELLGEGAEPTFLSLPGALPADLGRAAHRVRAGLLVLPLGLPGSGPDDLDAVLGESEVPLLLVR